MSEHARLFCMVLLGEQPLSLQAKKLDGYKKRLAEAAQRSMETLGSSFVVGEVALQVIWFHRKRASTDVDNILKPIADALAGVVYRDDSQIARCMADRVFLGDSIDNDGSFLRHGLTDLLDWLGGESAESGKSDHALVVTVRRIDSRILSLEQPWEVVP